MNRDEFLASIAERLGRRIGSAPSAREPEAARPRSAGREDAAQPSSDVLEHDGEQRTSIDRSALVDRFQTELERVGGIALRCASPRELEDRLIDLIERTQAESIVSWSRSELASFELERVWTSGKCTSWEGGDEIERSRYRDRAARAAIGLTSADFAIASTGSIASGCSARRPRCTSLLPAMHVVLLHASRIVERMAEALEKLATRDTLASQLLFVTGPSRTSDIENDLTIGVHGPASVAVLILDDGSVDRREAHAGESV